MSLGCSTRGRQNSWVIQIHLSLSLHHFLLSFFSFFALTRVGSSPPIEVLNPSLKLQAAQSIHQKHDPLQWGTRCYGLMNSVRGTNVCVSYLCTQGRESLLITGRQTADLHHVSIQREESCLLYLSLCWMWNYSSKNKTESLNAT